MTKKTKQLTNSHKIAKAYKDWKVADKLKTSGFEDIEQFDSKKASYKVEVPDLKHKGLTTFREFENSEEKTVKAYYHETLDYFQEFARWADQNKDKADPISIRIAELYSEGKSFRQISEELEVTLMKIQWTFKKIRLELNLPEVRF